MGQAAGAALIRILPPSLAEETQQQLQPQGCVSINGAALWSLESAGFFPSALRLPRLQVDHMGQVLGSGSAPS